MRTIHHWVLATFILCFFVILAGGIVRTTQSGMGCPDWPRCFGKWIPPTHASELPPDFEKYLGKQDIDHTFNAYHTWIEYFNRLLGVLLGLFAIIQTALLFPKRHTLRKPYRLAQLFLLLVIVTGLFGALVVKLNLAHISISVHLFFAILLVQVQLALLLSLKGKFSMIPVTSRLKSWIIFFLAILIIQSVLGTIVRIHIDDISKLLNYDLRETWLSDDPAPFIIHRTFSWLVLAGALFLTWQSRNHPALKPKVLWLCGTVVTSMVTGIVLFYLHMPAAAQPVHLLLACIAITQVFAILFQLRNTVYAGN